MQQQPDENQGVNELLLQEYEQFLSDVEMPIGWTCMKCSVHGPLT